MHELLIPLGNFTYIRIQVCASKIWFYESNVPIYLRYLKFVKIKYNSIESTKCSSKSGCPENLFVLKSQSFIKLYITSVPGFLFNSLSFKICVWNIPQLYDDATIRCSRDKLFFWIASHRWSQNIPSSWVYTCFTLLHSKTWIKIGISSVTLHSLSQ